MKGAGRPSPLGRPSASMPADRGSSGSLRQMLDASPSPRSRCSTPRAKTKSEGLSISPGMNLLSALRDQGISAELLGAKGSNSSAMAAQDGQQSMDDQQSGQQAMQMPQDSPTPSADAAPDQPLDDSSEAEDLIDPDVALALALECVKDWHTGTCKELAAMPQRRSDDPFNHGMWRWLSGLFGSRPAGVPRPFSTQEQSALVLGHAQLSQRMLQLQTLLFNLPTSVVKHAKKLQLLRTQLAAGIAENKRLADKYDNCIKEEGDHNAALRLTIRQLTDVQAKAKELQAEVLKLEQKVAAGKMLVNTLTSEKEKLEGLMKEATARQLLEVETLRGTCKELETQNARYMVEDMETQRATYQTLRSTQDQQLQDATKQLAAARQQGRDAVTAAEARAAAERQPLENAVLQLQNQLNATQLDLDRVTAQLDTTDAKFGDLVKKLARAGKEKEKAAAGLAAATTTNATLLKDKLQLEATIQSLQVEKDGIMLSTAKTLEELEEVNQRVSEATKEVAAKEAERAQLAAEVAALRDNTIPGLEKDHTSKEEELATAEEAKAKAEADHKEAQKELEELEQVLNMRAEEGAKLQQELEALRVQLKVWEKEEKEYQESREAVSKVEAMQQEVDEKEAAILERATLVLAAKQEGEAEEKATKETKDKIAAADKTIADLMEQLKSEQAAAAAHKEKVLKVQEEEEACLNEVLAKNAILQAGLDLLNSKTVEGIQADIAKEYKKLAKAEEEEEKIQQQRNRLQNEVNKAKHELDAKEKVVLGKGATLAERDEELQQLKAGTVLVARQAQTEATRAAQLTRAVGSMRAAATALEGEIAQEKQEGAELHAACSEYEKALQEASVAHEAALEAARAAQQVSAAARAAELLQEAALERGAAGDASAEQP